MRIGSVEVNISKFRVKLIDFKPVKVKPANLKQWIYAFSITSYELILNGIILFVAFAFAEPLNPLDYCSRYGSDNGSCADKQNSVIAWIVFIAVFVGIYVALLYVRYWFSKFTKKIDSDAKARDARIDAQSNAAYKRERDRLARIRESMTDAEWAAYEIQLENKRLLQEIRDKQGKTTGSSGFMYGVIDQ